MQLPFRSKRHGRSSFYLLTDGRTEDQYLSLKSRAVQHFDLQGPASRFTTGGRYSISPQFKRRRGPACWTACGGRDDHNCNLEPRPPALPFHVFVVTNSFPVAHLVTTHKAIVINPSGPPVPSGVPTETQSPQHECLLPAKRHGVRERQSPAGITTSARERLGPQRLATDLK